MSKSKKRLPRLKTVLLYVGAAFILLVLVGFLYEKISEYSDSKLTPPGKLLTVNKHKMHIYCSGQNAAGSPTVLLEAGGGQTYETWTKIQPEISKYTRVCSYDRSGLGFSEKSNDQRTNSEVVQELESLLKESGENGPYVMVGHSLGGFYTRLFTARNRDKVVGLLQIDPTVEEMSSKMVVSGTLMDKLATVLYGSAYYVGFARLVLTITPSSFGIDPSNARAGIAFNMALINPSSGFDDGKNLFSNINEIRAAANFADLPVIVLSADKSLAMAISQFGNGAAEWHKDLAKRLSNLNKRILVTNSSHFLQIDQPDIVNNNIMNLVRGDKSAFSY